MGRVGGISDENGFSYLAVLFMMVVMGSVLATAGQVWSTAAGREKEAELIFRGGQIRKAIGRYYEESPGAKAYPKKLEDLLNDSRWPVIKRHLRKLYVDPMTGKPDWEIIKAADGGIMGVKSRSPRDAYKRTNFPPALSGIEGKAKYNEWEFVYTPAPVLSSTTAQNG